MESTSLPVEVGLKQGDVLASVWFDLFMSTVATLVQNIFNKDDGAHIKYRLNGNQFNTRRLVVHPQRPQHS